jgi:hypothetical protein
MMVCGASALRSFQFASLSEPHAHLYPDTLVKLEHQIDDAEKSLRFSREMPKYVAVCSGHFAA